MTYLTWDTETTIKTSFKRKANPFDPDNYVVMSGYKRKGQPAHGNYFGRRVEGKQHKPHDWFTKMLQGTRLLVLANGKFDLLHAFQDPEHGERNLLAWMEYVAGGGNIWDIQLAEYLLEGMEPAAHMLSLDEMAPRYGGNLKFDEVKALWEAGVDTPDIDPQLLHRYLVGTETDHGDLGNTEKVFLGQLDRSRACGQTKSILLNMGSLICTTEMERNGMSVDKDLGLIHAEELAIEIAALSVELDSYLPRDLPFEFSWASPTQKSALIFGGKVKYEEWAPHLDDAGKLQYALMDVQSYYMANGALVAKEWADEQGEDWKFLHLQTVASGKNKGEYKTKVTKVENLEKPKGAVTDFYYTFPGVTKPKDRWATKTPGQYETGHAVIEELASRNIPFLKSLDKVSKLSKDLGTYYMKTNKKGETSGMLTLVQPDGLIHHKLNHTSVVTGRFSSSDPNLQNLSDKSKSKVKSLFVSRWRAKGRIIQSDFTALEIYVQAILTRAKQLIEDLKAGLDMHCLRVSQTKNISYEEAVRLCITEAIAEWTQARKKAKIFSFRRAYGAGAASIAEAADMSLEEAKLLIAAEVERYPEIETFFAKLEEQIKETSIPSGKKFPHPDNPALICQPRKSYSRTPDNKLYSYEERESPEFVWNKKGGRTTSFTPTEIKNYCVQGTGGEWAKAAMWLAVRAFYHFKNFDGLALLVNQVHDALYSDAHEDTAFEAGALLEAAMLAASDFMEWYFEWNVPVPVPSVTNIGLNMMDEGAMPEGFSERVHYYRMWMRKEYMAGYTPSFDVPIATAA